MVKTAEERREAQRGYAKTYREKHSPIIANANDMMRQIKSVPCGCGGNYKDIKQNRDRHCETARHRAWDEKINKVMPMFVEMGKSDTLEGADEKIETLFQKKRAYTPSQQVAILDKLTTSALKALGGNSVSLEAYQNRSVEPVKKQTKTKLEAHHENVVKICKEQEKKTPKRETHHERIIRIAAETHESSSSEEEPQNKIIEAQKIIPPTPCPSSSEAESEETEETETETESESDCSTQSEDQSKIYRTKEELSRDKERAIKRMNRFKSVEVVDEPFEPPKAIAMDEYLEEASKSNTDGSEILRKLGILTKTKKGGDKYVYV